MKRKNYSGFFYPRERYADRTSYGRYVLQRRGVSEEDPRVKDLLSFIRYLLDNQNVARELD